MNKKMKLLVLFLIISSFYEYIFADVKLTESNFTILLDWSYDGTKILFATSKNNNCFNLATISPDGTNETQITTDEGAEFYGGFYGDKIYYFYQTDEGIKLYRVNSDGTNKTLFSTIAQGNHYNVNSCRISSTAAKMAYVLEDYYSGRPLWVINLNDGSKTQLTNASIGYNNEFDFSPDGQWIVFSSTSGYLYKIKTDNTDLTQLTTFYSYYPAWSPDGTKIAFEYKGDIWTINPDGTGLTNLTGDDWSTYDELPQWSPDNTKILWGRNDNLWIMNSDGSNKQQLTSDIGWWLSFRWNKQDNKIAFCDGQNIYTVNSDGSGLQKITNNFTNNLNPIFNYNNLWSGDYDKIAYSRYFTDPFECRLTIMNKDGSNKYDLISSTYEVISSISFAPHKTKILYDLYERNNYSNSKIYTINSDGTNETYLGEGRDPVWSPDTNYIAYFSTSYPYYLCVMNSNGSNKRTIAEADGWLGISWSSDSTKIVYVYDNNLWIADLLNSTTQQITNSSYQKAFPVFSPDNSKIAFVANSRFW